MRLEHRRERRDRRVEEGASPTGQGQDGRPAVGGVLDTADPAGRLEAVDALADGAGRDGQFGRQVLDAAPVPSRDELQELELAGRESVLGPEPVVERVVEPRLEPHEVGEHPGEVGHGGSTSWFLPEKVPGHRRGPGVHEPVLTYLPGKVTWLAPIASFTLWSGRRVDRGGPLRPCGSPRATN